MKKIDEYTQKALQGDNVAQCNLGACFYDGCFVPQDYSKAIFWLKKSASKGNLNARFLLGCCYFFGNGVKQNQRLAQIIFDELKKDGFLI